MNILLFIYITINIMNNSKIFDDNEHTKDLEEEELEEEELEEEEELDE